MNRLILIALLFTCTVAHAAVPQQAATEQFASQIDLSALRSIALMDQQTVKTLDSFSRQLLERIAGTSTVNGQDPVFTVLDIANHPDAYQTLNLIKIKSLPLRTEFRRVGSIPSEEQERIVKEGTVSMDLLNQPEVQEMLAKVQSHDLRKADAIRQIKDADDLLQALSFSIVKGAELFFPASVVPPAVKATDTSWHHLVDLAWTDPEQIALAKAQHENVPAALPGYTVDEVKPALIANQKLHDAWKLRDAAGVNAASIELADSLTKINPSIYPSETIRHVEVIYNKLFKMTLFSACFYFFALVCFLMSTSSGLSNLRLWGLRLLVLGFLMHSAGIAVRWWLTDSWLPPIKNEFESVMFSAWFGVLAGTLYEVGFFPALWQLCVKLWRMIFSSDTPAATTRLRPASGPAGRGILGAAASFVGMLSMLALFAVPFVFHISIGENVGQVNGVLMSYWLYIHVMMVTASYAMIGMAFLLSMWWLIKYYIDYGTLSRVSSRQLESGGHGFEPVFPAGGGAAGLSMSATLAKMMFFPVAIDKPLKKVRIADKVLHGNSAVFLSTLDACNLVVLQLAFWMLGIGIVFGAIWADQSWGRFWAWDPKETFALVTWIAYLIIVHVRVATQDKAWWTSVLSIVGFFLMLFNWIGVNYFLPGLHSYAG